MHGSTPATAPRPLPFPGPAPTRTRSLPPHPRTLHVPIPGSAPRTLRRLYRRTPPAGSPRDAPRSTPPTRAPRSRTWRCQCRWPRDRSRAQPPNLRLSLRESTLPLRVLRLLHRRLRHDDRPPPHRDLRHLPHQPREHEHQQPQRRIAIPELIAQKRSLTVVPPEPALPQLFIILLHALETAARLDPRLLIGRIARMKRFDASPPFFRQPDLMLVHPVVPRHRRERILGHQSRAKAPLPEHQSQKYRTLGRVFRVLHARVQVNTEPEVDNTPHDDHPRQRA